MLIIYVFISTVGLFLSVAEFIFAHRGVAALFRCRVGFTTTECILLSILVGAMLCTAFTKKFLIYRRRGNTRLFLIWVVSCLYQFGLILLGIFSAAPTADTGALMKLLCCQWVTAILFSILLCLGPFLFWTASRPFWQWIQREWDAFTTG